MSTPSWEDRLRGLAGDLRGEIQRAGRWALVGQSPSCHELLAYRGYGAATRVLVQGRAVECVNVPRSTATDTTWRNLLSTYRRIDARPLSRARVTASVGGADREIVADDEGFFRAWLELPAPLPALDGEPWQPVELRLVSPLLPRQPDVRCTGQLLVPPSAAAFGVISDIDDTVIQSRIANFLQAVRTVMLGNARTRLPFPGVAAFYQALERGGDGARRNPIFYVSSSPWNIYDVIAEFMELQRIPVGPLCLRDWDITPSALARHRLKTYKEPLIREILDLYPTLPFILIGDSSQKDPEIYRAIVDAYPGRILAVYIRSVAPDPARSASVQALARQVLAAGSSLLLADDTYAAATHAADHGWITRESLVAVKEEKRADTGEGGTKADAPGAQDEPGAGEGAPTIVVE